MCTIELQSSPINNTVSDGLVSPGCFPGIRCTAAKLQSIWWWQLQQFVRCDYLLLLCYSLHKGWCHTTVSGRHWVCQSFSCQREDGFGGSGNCFRDMDVFHVCPTGNKPNSRPRISLEDKPVYPICPGMINACHMSDVLRQMWPVVKQHTHTILQEACFC